MPEDSLIWSDVRFDHVVAQRAAAECERAARLLRETADRRSSLAGQALAAGQGPWRDQLASRIAGVDQRATDLESRLRALAHALLDASARARAEQLHREAARFADLGHLGTEGVPG